MRYFEAGTLPIVTLLMCKYILEGLRVSVGVTKEVEITTLVLMIVLFKST